MHTVKTNSLFLIMFIAVILLSACSSPPAEEAPLPSATPAPEIISLEELEEWDLLWISDSSGWDVAEVYAAMVSEDTGKVINLTDLWTGHLPVGLVLDALTGNYQGNNMKYARLAEYVAEAEIVVLYGNPMESINPERPGDWECIPPGPYSVSDCSPEVFEIYKEHVAEVFRLILELREGQPTIIRTYDAYNPLINQWKEAGVYEDCKQCWGYYNDAMREAAAEMGIPIAPVADLWNGPDFNIDPDSDLGYTRDGIHPNALGAEVIAQALRELGYDPIVP